MTEQTPERAEERERLIAIIDDGLARNWYNDRKAQAAFIADAILAASSREQTPERAEERERLIKLIQDAANSRGVQTAEHLADRILAASSRAGGNYEGEKCFICDVRLARGDRVLDDMSGETAHLDCYGEDRDAFVKDLDTGEPLGPEDALPKGYAWEPPPRASSRAPADEGGLREAEYLPGAIRSLERALKRTADFHAEAEVAGSTETDRRASQGEIDDRGREVLHEELCDLTFIHIQSLLAALSTPAPDRADAESLRAELAQVKAERDQARSDLAAQAAEVERLRSKLVDEDAKLERLHVSQWRAGAQDGYRVGYAQALLPVGADPEALNRLLASSLEPST